MSNARLLAAIAHAAKALHPEGEVCGTYNPCKYAERLIAQGERDRGYRDQQITTLEAKVKQLEEQLQKQEKENEQQRGVPSS